MLTPTLHTQVTYAPGGTLRAEFEVEHDPSAPAGQGTGQIWTGGVDGVAAGTQGSLAVPAGTLTDGWVVRWRARSLAGQFASPWSDWQQLTVKRPESAPAVQELQVTPAQTVNDKTVTSSLTPALRATVTDPRGDALKAEFEVEHDPSAPAGQDGWIVRWRVRASSTTTASGWSDWQQLTIDLPKPAVDGLQVAPARTVDGITATKSLTPTVSAVVTNPAGTSSRVEFEVEHDPSAPAGQGTGQIWAGAVDDVASGMRTSVTVPDGELTDSWLVRWRARATAGQVTAGWSAWQKLKIDLIQAGEEPLAQTSAPVLNTDRSFTVTAWLRWSDKDGDYSVVEQRGGHQAPFRLGNTPGDGLVFTFTAADQAGATVEGVKSGVEPPVNQWFHLAGVYDAATKKVSLYLNGQLLGSETLGFASWQSEAVTALGAQMLGDLDELWIHSRALPANEVAQSAGIASSSGPVSTPSKMRSTGAVTQATAANNYVYDRIKDTNECLAKPLSLYEAKTARNPLGKNPLGYTKNHFAYCISAQPSVVIEKKINGRMTETDIAAFDLVIIGRTFQGSREIEFDVHVLDVDDNYRGSRFENESFTMGMSVTGSPSNNACKQVVGGQYQQVYAGQEEYWNDRSVTFKFESPEPAAGGWTPKTNENIATCVFALTMSAPHVPNLKYNNLGPKQTVRCDSASYINWYGSGCIFRHLVPSIKLRQAQFPNAFDHISKAFSNPSATDPKPGGNRLTWPKQVTTPDKVFPGFSKLNPLHRLRDDNRIDRNRNRSVSICARQIKASWKNSDNVPWTSTVEQCDEFPFASTYEGAWVWWTKTPPTDPCCSSYPSNPARFNMTVKLIPAGENRSWGDLSVGGLGRFYVHDRVLSQDAFFVRLYDSAEKLLNPQP
ncbi:LamG-like jellyroll fold domain-containing protein [Nonomuraea candida]|uniref:LamG-like jellyroll fold domain-containing protein n=1 Tax=Nonomuraea candida TaxID=359159 RepID=UPI0012FC8754|nr:LamG-like jellyroll fold domain-containing protein [Nonomuraea candida]